MITADDIEAFAEADQEIFNRVNKRVATGVPREMELSSGETLPYIRAAFRWQMLALDLWDDKVRNGEDAMRLHTKDSKYHEAKEARRG